MNWSQEAIRNLREILASLYPQISDAGRVVKDAELDVAVLRAPGEVRAGDEQEAVVDGNELRVIAGQDSAELL